MGTDHLHTIGNAGLGYAKPDAGRIVVIGKQGYEGVISVGIGGCIASESGSAPPSGDGHDLLIAA